jgi:hypothetical protein
MTKPTTLTKINWVKYATKALRPLPEPNIQTTKESPWQCAACRSHRAGIHAVTGHPVCVRCEVSNTVVPGPALDLSRVWQRAIATSGDDELGVIAVLAGTRLVSPMARAQFTLGMPADEFAQTLQQLVLTARGLTCDDYGIWRRADGSRPNGTDAMDLLMGIPGMWSPEQIRRFDADDPVTGRP